MSEVCCFTSATFAYLDRVRVLGQTLRQHHPDWVFCLCLSDQEPPGFVFDPSNEPLDYIVRVEDLGIRRLNSWIYEHDVVELCTAVKGQMLVQLLEQGAKKVVYLDPDIAILGSLAEIEHLLDRYNILLTPHQLIPDTKRDAIIDNEIGSLAYGIYNLGFVAVANRPEGMRFAYWWRDRLRDFCFDDVPRGLFTDQRWCDHVPSFFEDVHIMRDPGYNVASWNLSQRPLTINTAGEILVAGRPLRFFHFTKIDWVGETMLERYSAGQIEVFELIHWYKRLLKKHAVHGLPAQWWAYGHYSDGRPIPKEHRVAYRNRADLKSRFPEPFVCGANSLADYLTALMP
ncbi:MAG TPA: hypothetical protein VMB73_10685 [Acetobacteraceae bacterium]|nr:hypothetical protein [Acetobacteraceae bacterium]